MSYAQTIEKVGPADGVTYKFDICHRNDDKKLIVYVNKDGRDKYIARRGNKQSPMMRSIGDAMKCVGVRDAVSPGLINAWAWLNNTFVKTQGER